MNSTGTPVRKRIVGAPTQATRHGAMVFVCALLLSANATASEVSECEWPAARTLPPPQTNKLVQQTLGSSLSDEAHLNNEWAKAAAYMRDLGADPDALLRQAGDVLAQLELAPSVNGDEVDEPSDEV